MDNNRFNILVDNKLCDDIFKSRKDHVVRYITKHFIENENYIIICPNKNIKGGSGRNKKDYKLTPESFVSLYILK